LATTSSKRSSTKARRLRNLKNKAKGGDLTTKEKKELSEEEKEYKSKRKLVQEKLIKFATRIPAFMYLTDFRENTLQDVITKLDGPVPNRDGLDGGRLPSACPPQGVQQERMNEAVFAFRRYEDASCAIPASKAMRADPLRPLRYCRGAGMICTDSFP
jgi:hypothetical protein